jgi:hypothetical protein
LSTAEFRSCTIAFDNGKADEQQVQFIVNMNIPAATWYKATGQHIDSLMREAAMDAIRAQFAFAASEQHGDEVWQRGWVPDWDQLTIVPEEVEPIDLPYITHRFLGA